MKAQAGACEETAFQVASGARSPRPKQTSGDAQQELLAAHAPPRIPASEGSIPAQ